MARRYAPRISYRLREIPIKQIKVWGDAQARKLDREGIAELAKSIRAEGLMNPPLVQKASKNSYLLMSGQRRLAAMKRLRAKKIPVHVLTKKSEYDLQDAKAASLVENIHRNEMNFRETANACKFLNEEMGKADAARSIGMSIPTFNKYLGFAGVPEKLKAAVPELLTRDEATRLYLAVPSTGKALAIAKRIAKLESSLKKRYITALAHAPKASHAKLLKRAKSLRVKQNVTFKLSKTNAARLAREAARRDMTQDELAGEIVSAHMKRKKRSRR